jgi:PKD repeat protein
MVEVDTMVFKKKKSSLGVGLLFILTAFVSVQMPVGAAGEPPVAEAGGPYIGEECSSMLLNASGSSDPDGDPLTYRWNISGLWIENYYYPYLEWTWFDDFSGVVTLEVSDGDLTAVDTAEIIVLNVPPVILSIEGPTEVDVGTEFLLLVNFFDGMSDPRFKIASLDTYTATFSWGDGSSTVFSLGAEEFWANASHVYSNVGVYHIIITIVDDNGGEAIAEWDVIVGGMALVDAGADGIIDEGSMFISSGFLADSDSPMYTAIVDYGDGTEAQPLLLNLGNTFDLNHTYFDNDVYIVLVTVFNEGVEYGSDTANVTVNNVPPSIESMSVSPADPLPPGVPVELSGMFSDPGILDMHTATIEWGDGQTTSINVPFGTYLVTGNHIYASAGAYMVTLTVFDDDGGSDSMTLEYYVVDVEDVDAGPDGFINEGDMFASAGSFTSSGDGLYTAFVDYGDGSGSQPLCLSSGCLFDLTHQYLENGVYTIVVAIFKDGVACMSDSVLVTVYNVAPIITSLSGSPTDSVHLGNAIYLVGEFTDPGVLDSHIPLIQWGDGQTTTIDLPAGVYQISGRHTYARAGVYTITLTVTDDDGGSDSKSINVEINKPCCGCHTGCGWVKFQFDSKYKKGHTPPGCNTEFQFHLAHLNVHSHMNEWLSIIGTTVKCKGVGHWG